MQPAEDDVMRRESRHRHESIFAGGLGQRVILRGLALAGLSYWLFQKALDAGASLAYAQTMAFATLIFAEIWHIFDSRSSSTIFRKNPFGNQMLLGAVAVSAILPLLAIYTPPGTFALGT